MVISLLFCLIVTFFFAGTANQCNLATTRCCGSAPYCCGCQNTNASVCTRTCVQSDFDLADLTSSSIPSNYRPPTTICGQSIANIASATSPYSCYVGEIITPANQSGVGLTVYKANTNLVCEYYKVLSNMYTKGTCSYPAVTFCKTKLLEKMVEQANNQTCTTKAHYDAWVQALGTNQNTDPNLYNCLINNVFTSYNLGLNYGPNCVDFQIS